MGKRGPPPKPTRLKVIEGTYRPDKAIAGEPLPPVSVPRCPPWLLPEAKRAWKRIGKLLKPLGLIAEIDYMALAMLCQSWARWREAEEVISKAGPVQTTPSGYQQQAPQVSIANARFAQLQQMLGRFGATPADRTRVVSALMEDDEDKAREFLFGANAS